MAQLAKEKSARHPHPYSRPQQPNEDINVRTRDVYEKKKKKRDHNEDLRDRFWDPNERREGKRKKQKKFLGPEQAFLTTLNILLSMDPIPFFFLFCINFS